MRARGWRWLGVLMLLSSCMATSSAAMPEEAVSVPAPTVAPPQDGISEPVPAAVPELLPEEPAPPGSERQFSTDFSRHTVPYDEILSGGPPKDGIPAIDAPQVVRVQEADAWLADVEPVILVQVDDHVRAYPIQILMWHEIANDSIGDVPIAVTFCPLCNTAIAFDRRFEDGGEALVLDFGTTGRLRYSNLIMYDRQTETWWQQATGEGIAGQFAGRRLDFVPANIISWADYKAAYPEGEVLSRATGLNRPYGNNPYAGYDDVDNTPFLYQGPETPGELLPMARVLTVEVEGEAVAYSYATLAAQGVANDAVGGEPLVVMWQPGVASALDQSAIAAGREVGTVVAFSRELDGEILTFRTEDGRIVDEDSGSVWDVFGTAIEGPRAGQHLGPIVGINHFWFSWAAFRPETRVYLPEEASQSMGAPTSVPASDATSGQNTPLELAGDFEILVYTGAGELGGERVMFSELFARGKPVAVEMWAGLCASCRRALPEMETAYGLYKDDIVFVALDVGEYTGLGNEEDARALYAELGMSFPTGTILDPAVMSIYRVTGIPTTLTFGPNGELFHRSGGVVPAVVLGEEFAALLAASR